MPALVDTRSLPVPLSSPALSHRFPGWVTLLRPSLDKLAGSLSRSCRAQWGRREGGGGGSFSAGPWRRAASEPVSLRFRRGWNGLGSGKEAPQPAPITLALHLLHPPSSPHWFLRQVQHAETPTPSVPCSSSPGLQAAMPAGSCSPSLLGVVWMRGGHLKVREKAMSGEGTYCKSSLPPTAASFSHIRASACLLVLWGEAAVPWIVG